jgi:hypothetical protein
MRSDGDRQENDRNAVEIVVYFTPYGGLSEGQELIDVRETRGG